MFEELIRDLEIATEGEPHLGARVLAAVRNATLLSVEQYGEELWLALENNGDGERYEIKHLRDPTSSLDAALTLVPEGMPVDIHIGPRGLGNDAIVYQMARSTDELGRRVTAFVPHEAKAVRGGTMHWTPAPVQVCIAALRARQTVPPTVAGGDVTTPNTESSPDTTAVP